MELKIDQGFLIQLTIVVIIHILFCQVFVPTLCILLTQNYYCKIFKSEASWTFQWKIFQWISCSFFLLIVQAVYILVSQKMVVLQNLVLIQTVLLLLPSRVSRVRLCDPIDSSPTGSSIRGIPQARILEWGAIAFSVRQSRRGSDFSVHKWSFEHKPHSLVCVMSVTTFIHNGRVEEAQPNGPLSPK